MEININDILVLKKKHPCGCDLFEVKRVGMDIGIKCTSCGHYVLVPRNKLIKNIKGKKINLYIKTNLGMLKNSRTQKVSKN